MATCSYSASFLLLLSLGLLCDAQTPDMIRPTVGMISVINGGEWGTWRSDDMCPIGTYAKGFMLKVEQYQSAGDDSALNGITLICTSEDNQAFFNIMSASGQWGCWTQPQWCPSGYLLAFRMRVETSQGAGDDTGANNVDFRCSDGSMLMGQGSSYGSYGSWSNDCGGKAICGLRTKIEEWTTAGDDTALDDVQFYCCE
uniref:vitelline membrane outer layer protein 1-like n=1 Tax=Myxine glutinosa TaxID=7769 RepID=UPI00358E9E83